MSHVVTASATADGHPVYLTPSGEWSGELSAAQVLETESERDEKLATARSQEALVCDPYLIEVTVADGNPSATTLRERIRAEGPTTHYGIAASPRS